MVQVGIHALKRVLSLTKIRLSIFVANVMRESESFGRSRGVRWSLGVSDNPARKLSKRAEEFQLLSAARVWNSMA